MNYNLGTNNGNYKHGMKFHPYYHKWKDMKQRCYNKLDTGYSNYGGRGIYVCKEWKNDPKAYIEYISLLKNEGDIGYSIDRIDNDKNYEPGNLRWVDRIIQATNQRVYKNNTSGYVGVYYHKNSSKWKSQITYKNAYVFIGYYLNKEKAIDARNLYIITNNLPHKIQKRKNGITK